MDTDRMHEEIEIFLDTLGDLAQATRRTYRSYLRSCHSQASLTDTTMAEVWVDLGASKATIRLRRSIISRWLTYWTDTQGDKTSAELARYVHVAMEGLPEDALRAPVKLVLKAFVDQVKDPWNVKQSQAWAEKRPSVRDLLDVGYERLRAVYNTANPALPPLPPLATGDVPDGVRAAVAVLMKRFEPDALVYLTWRYVDTEQPMWLIEDTSEPYVPRAVYHAPNETLDRALQRLWIWTQACVGRDPRDTDPLIPDTNGAPLSRLIIRGCRHLPPHLIGTEAAKPTPVPDDVGDDPFA